MKPGFYKNLPIEIYHTDPTLSKTGLSNLAKNPLAYKTARETPSVKRTVYEIGTAGHLAILEPELYGDQVVVPPAEVLGKNGSRSTNAYKAWAAERSDKTIITQTQADDVKAFSKKVLNHKSAGPLLTGGIAELSCFWEETWNGQKIMLKVRPDYLPGNRIVVDLKTCKDASPRGFAKDAHNLHYHWSAWLTLRGLTAATGQPHNEYVFIAVEKVFPYHMACYLMSYAATPDIMRLAETKVTKLLDLYAECLRTDTWPGYSEDVLDIQYPAYAFKNIK